MTANEVILVGVGRRVWLGAACVYCRTFGGGGIAIGRSSGVSSFFVAHGEQPQCPALVTEIRTFKKRYHLFKFFDLTEQPDTFVAEKNICVH